jgi:hypothetical protein
LQRRESEEEGEEVSRLIALFSYVVLTAMSFGLTLYFATEAIKGNTGLAVFLGIGSLLIALACLAMVDTIYRFT